MNGKFVYNLMFLSTTAWALVNGLPAQAAPLFDVPFTSDTPGNAPATAAANAGGVSVNPTFIAPGRSK